MWHIVIRDGRGVYHREVSDFKPDKDSLEYWEVFYSEHFDAYNSYKTAGVVINIFESED